jgi:ATP-dependent Clp protease ATP-binding subunit ClpB
MTDKAREAIIKAQDLATEHGQAEVGVEHLFYELCRNNEDILPALLRKMGANIPMVTDALHGQIKSMPSMSGGRAGGHLSDGLNRLFIAAEKERTQLRDDYLSVEHLLLGLFSIKDGGKVRQIFEGFSIDKNTVLKALHEIRGNQRVTSSNPEATYESLAKYGLDLTQLASTGKLDPVIGRDDEIRRIMEILSRKTKNNPVLIGEPGVGKTAIAEGLAQRIVNGDVPDGLKNKRVWSLDISAIVAGAKFKGEFEERLKAVLKEIVDSSGDILLFIDELHTVVGAGKSDGALDAGNMLKPLLARGQLHCIGATTLNEYRKYIEKDSALERRFQPVLVKEPTVEDTISILRGLRERYEVHHGIRIQDGALVSAAVLSHRYISGRFLPDKAIDLIDEASARLRTQIDSMPSSLDEILRKLMQLEIEQEALRRESDKASKERLNKIEREIADLNEAGNALKAQWQREKEVIGEVRKIREEIDAVKVKIEKAERIYDLKLAAELKYGQLRSLEERLQKAESIISNESSNWLLKQEVCSDEIAAVIARWTGIPVTKLLQGEMDKLSHLEDELRHEVVGQHEAVSAVSDAIMRARSGINDPDRPLGSFMFIGPTGVGKTELARSLAANLFDDQSAMIRIDMSEYMEKHSVSRLIGAPPGYVGFDDGGQLTEAVRRKPYCVLLFDEIEKAHHDVFNVLLQILDDGHLTDSHGRKVNFKNCVVIMTSNIGSSHMFEPSDEDSLKEKVMADVRSHFRPEFLNRVDEIIPFNTLNIASLSEIVKLQLVRLNKRLREQNITLIVTESAIAHIAEEGWDPAFGARPIKRAIQRLLENRMALEIVRGNISDGALVTVSFDGKNEKAELNFEISWPPDDSLTSVD